VATLLATVAVYQTVEALGVDLGREERDLRGGDRRAAGELGGEVDGAGQAVDTRLSSKATGPPSGSDFGV
jgi:hypothetical protein